MTKKATKALLTCLLIAPVSCEEAPKTHVNPSQNQSPHSPRSCKSVGDEYAKKDLYTDLVTAGMRRRVMLQKLRLLKTKTSDGSLCAGEVSYKYCAQKTYVTNFDKVDSLWQQTETRRLRCQVDNDGNFLCRLLEPTAWCRHTANRKDYVGNFMGEDEESPLRCGKAPGG